MLQGVDQHYKAIVANMTSRVLAPQAHLVEMRLPSMMVVDREIIDDTDEAFFVDLLTFTKHPTITSVALKVAKHGRRQRCR